MIHMNTITFFLMNEKGFYVLSQVLKCYPSDLIECVIGSEDKAVSKDYNLEIKQLCAAYAIPYHDKSSAVKIKSTYCFLIGWRWLVDVQSHVIVFHDSLLPKYRGFNPIVTSLINGEKHLGVTALFAADKYDTGDILMQKCIDIEYPITIHEAINKICPIYFYLVNALIDLLVKGETVVSHPQNALEATYSLWRDELDYKINWSQSAVSIKRFIDAVGFPYKGASAYIDTEKVRILSVDVCPDVVIENREPGKVIFNENENPVVVCGVGLLKIMSIVSDEGHNKLPLNKFRVRFH